eukprot:g8266.t1
MPLISSGFNLQKSVKPVYGITDSRALTPFFTRLATTPQCSKKPNIPDSTLSVLSNDLEYLESALGVDLHSPLESVAEAHDQVVCTLNPLVAKQRSKELESKLQELHQELTEAHSAIHSTEDCLNQTIDYLIEIEDQLTQLPKITEDFKLPTQPAPPQRTPSFRNMVEIENSLELKTGLREYWYPVEFSSKLRTPGARLDLELFGDRWFLVRSQSGRLMCYQYPSNYTTVYQGDNKSIPVAEMDGFVWIWPGDTTPSEIPRCSVPPSEFQIHAELTMEVPVEHGLLLENLLDLAHAPFTHTSTFAKGWPIPDLVKFHTSKVLGGNWDPYPIDMSFETPCMVLSLIGLAQPGKIERGARAESCQHHLHQLHVCLPTDNRTTKLMYRMSLDFMHWTRHLPGIQNLWKNVARQVLGEDLTLVIGQQDRMLRGSSVWKNPVAYDKLGIRYRRWRNSVGSENQEQNEKQLMKKLSAGEIFSPGIEL